LRIRHGCSYHGLSFNIDMDLRPFGRINPCGYQGMQVTQLRDLLPVDSLRDDLFERTAEALVTTLASRLGYAVVTDAESGN